MKLAPLVRLRSASRASVRKHSNAVFDVCGASEGNCDIAGNLPLAARRYRAPEQHVTAAHRDADLRYVDSAVRLQVLVHRCAEHGVRRASFRSSISRWFSGR